MSLNSKTGIPREEILWSDDRSEEMHELRRLQKVLPEWRLR
jgi:hypothetical protein